MAKYLFSYNIFDEYTKTTFRKALAVINNVMLANFLHVIVNLLAVKADG